MSRRMLARRLRPPRTGFRIIRRGFYSFDLDDEGRNRMFFQRYDPADEDVGMDYIAAHSLLPEYHGFPHADPHPDVEAALNVLARREPSSQAMRRALVILGHSPTPRSLTALSALASADSPWSAFARFALSECETYTREAWEESVPV